MNVWNESTRSIQFTDYGFRIATESTKPLTPELKKEILHLAKEHFAAYVRSNKTQYFFSYNQLESSALFQDDSILSIEFWLDPQHIQGLADIARNQSAVLEEIDALNNNR